MSLKQRLTTAVIATATLTAQSTTIIGNVRDAETGEALIGVAIAVSNTTKGAASDLDGNYSLGNLGAGTYTLRASYLSYETQEQTITLGKEQTATLDWRMTPQSTRLNEVTIAAKKQLDNERSLMNERKNSTLAIEHRSSRTIGQRNKQRRRRRKENNRSIDSRRRPTDSTRIRRQIQHNDTKHPANCIAQPRQKTDTPEPISIVDNTKHNRKQSI